MQIEKVESTLNGDPIKCGHFNSSMYDSYIEFPVNLDTGKKYTIHGYIKSSVAGQISCEGATSNVSTEWSHVVMTITPSQQKSLELKFYPGEFWIYQWKLEVGEVNSNWTPSPLDAKYDLISLGSEVKQLSDSITQKVWKEDINDATKEINKSVTTVGQDAEKVYWLIDKNSENQASMTLTSDLYKLVAENINLTGKVTFESFSSAMQENWNGLSTTASNAASKASEAVDAVNNSISKVVTEYYKSTSSEEPLDGKWGEASPLWEEGYYIWSRTVSTNLNGDKEVSEPVCITGNKGSDGVGISSIISQYYLSSSSTELKDGSWTDNESPTWVKGKYIWSRSKLTWDNGDVTTTTATLAKALNSANENAVTAWNTTQDIIKNIYVTNKTTIDGGRIETGTVTADAIATDAIVSKNYVKDSTGSFLNLADGSFDSKYLKWDSTGAITATSGNIGGLSLKDGVLSSRTETYLLPDMEVFLTLRDAIISTSGNNPVDLPLNLYDFSGDNEIDLFDFTIAKRYINGQNSETDFKAWKYSKTSPVTFEINPQNANKAIYLSAEDMWGKERKSQIGIGYIYSNEIECDNIKIKDTATHSTDTSLNINFRRTSSLSETNTFEYDYNISGCGMLIVNCAIWTDETSDFGTTSCAIYIDNACVSANRDRINTESSVEIDTGCSFVWWFYDESPHTLKIIAGSTKNGTKTYTQSIQALFGLNITI